MNKEKEYALYKGEELLSMGTLEEIAKEQKVKPETIYWYMHPTYAKRTSETKGRRVVCLDEWI